MESQRQRFVAEDQLDLGDMPPFGTVNAVNQSIRVRVPCGDPSFQLVIIDMLDSVYTQPAVIRPKVDPHIAPHPTLSRTLHNPAFLLSENATGRASVGVVCWLTRSHRSAPLHLQFSVVTQ